MLYVDNTTGSFSMEDIQCCLSAVSSQRAVLVENYAFCIDKELSLKVYQLLQKGLKQEYGISEPPLFEYNGFGKPYNPTIKFIPNHIDDVDESQLGMLVVNGLCENINYKYMNGVNCLYLNFNTHYD